MGDLAPLLYGLSILFSLCKVYCLRALRWIEQRDNSLVLRAFLRAAKVRLRLVRGRAHNLEASGRHAGDRRREEGAVQGFSTHERRWCLELEIRTVTYEPR